MRLDKVELGSARRTGAHGRAGHNSDREVRRGNGEKAKQVVAYRTSYWSG